MHACIRSTVAGEPCACTRNLHEVSSASLSCPAQYVARAPEWTCTQLLHARIHACTARGTILCSARVHASENTFTCALLGTSSVRCVVE